MTHFLVRVASIWVAAAVAACACGSPQAPVKPAGAGEPSTISAGQERVTAATASPYVERLRSRLGPNTNLSIDSNLQRAAEASLGSLGKAGAVVAFEPNTGAVRALFSVSGDRGDPLLVAHVPASTFKVFAAIAGL